jgi:hypothetical protein
MRNLLQIMRMTNHEKDLFKSLEDNMKIVAEIINKLCDEFEKASNAEQEKYFRDRLYKAQEKLANLSKEKSDLIHSALKKHN